MKTCRLLGLLFLHTFLVNGISAAAIPAKVFPILTVGFNTYSNATVTDVSGGALSLRHAGGITSLRLDSLDAKTRGELGIQAPPPSAKTKVAGRATEAASTGGTPAVIQPSEQAGEGAWKLLGDEGAKLKGPVAVVVYGFAAVGLLLLIIGKILFVVAAFRASPGWGIGVLLGGFTCGVVPLIFFFTHLEECKKAFIFGAAGFFLFIILGIAVPNFVRAKQAAEAKKRAMILCHHQAWA